MSWMKNLIILSAVIAPVVEAPYDGGGWAVGMTWCRHSEEREGDLSSISAGRAGPQLPSGGTASIIYTSGREYKPGGGTNWDMMGL